MNASPRSPVGSVTGLRGGLGRTLLTAFLLLTIVPLGLNAWLVVSRTHQEMRQATRDRLLALVTLKIAQVGDWLARQEQALTRVSAELAARPATTVLFQTPPDAPAHAAAVGELQPLLSAALAQQPGFQSFYLVRSPQAAAPDALLMVGSQALTDTLGVWQAAPIPSAQSADAPVGTLLGRLDPAPLVAVVAHAPELGATGRSYLVAADGRPLWSAPAPPAPLHSPGIAAALSGARGSALYLDYQGQPVVGAYAWLPELGLAIIVEQSQQEAFALADDLAALLLASTLVVALLTTMLAAVIIRRITRPIVSLTMRAVQIADGDFWQSVPEDRQDEIGILAQAFNVMTAELRQLYENLEGMVAERTRQLAEANRQLQHYAMRLTLSAEIGRIATSIRDPDTLLAQVTRLIRDSYELAHVGVLLVDENDQRVTCRASASQDDWDQAAPLQTTVGDETAIGQAMATGQPRLACPTPTCTELAVPLHTGQQRLGVLDLWAYTPEAFSDLDVRVLQSLGDQISIAIENARAYAQEQETTRRLRQLDALRVQSLGSLSHEFATALNSIIGFSRLILKGVDGPLTDVQRSDVTAIHRSGRHLLGMLDDVLDLVELERGTLVLERRLLDMNELLAGVLATMQTVAEGPSVAVDGVICPGLPAVRGDGKRLRQTLIHLIADIGQRAERVSISADAPGGPPAAHVCIRIAGLVDPATPPAEPTAASEVVWDEKGAGLGLALSKRVIELHGGQLRTQPAGEGWVYVVWLPAATAASE